MGQVPQQSESRSTHRVELGHFTCGAQHVELETQRPSHDFMPEGQAQRPPTQASDPPQTVPQRPQLFRSVSGFRQRPPHMIWPPGQHSFRLATHSPGRLGHSRRPPGQPQVVPLQTKSPSQELPQLPQ